MQTKRKNMTVGSPTKLIVQFFVPLLFGMLFQQFYSMVDTIIVGRFLGPEALAAVGSTGSINFMIIGFCMGVCGGFTIPVAKAFGAQDEASLRKYVANSIWLAIGFALVMTGVVAFFCKEILGLMNTPEDIFKDAYSYIFVIFLGIPVVYFYNLLSGILRALGDSKTPVYFLVIASLLNIVFDLVAIIALGMGVAGAAWATVLAQAISGVLCLGYIRKKKIITLTASDWQPNKRYMKDLCYMGIPMGLQYSITAIGGIILQTAVNGLGSLAVASITAAGKVGMFLTCAFDAIGATMATYAGQNVGAGKLERVTQGIKSSCLITGIYSVVIYAVLLLYGESLIGLFIDSSEQRIIQDAMMYLKITGLTFFFVALINIFRYTIQGVGFANIAILAGVFEMVARMIVGFIFVPKFGYIAACFSNPAAWIMADIFLIPAYIYVMKKLKNEQNLKAEQLVEREDNLSLEQ